MANIKSAQKRDRQDKKRRVINLARSSALKTAVKKVLAAIENKEEADTVKKLFVAAESQLARAKRKVLHPNATARKVGRLAKHVNVYTKSIK